jgi:hypothetical protein
MDINNTYMLYEKLKRKNFFHRKTEKKEISINHIIITVYVGGIGEKKQNKIINFFF